MTRATFSHYIYFTTVFLTGAAVLIFEVAAVRMLAPYFGSSLYVLSSVLTVVLAALSLGYFIGGRIADRMPYFLPLYIIIGMAGVVMLSLQAFSLYLLPYSNDLFSITTGPLILSLLLFFTPAFLLGIDSPFVITLLSKTVTPDHSGAVVGSVFFWSTIGSIVGSLTAGFWFIPYIGLTNTIGFISFGLIVWAIIASMLLTKINSTTLPPLPFQPLWFAVIGLLLGGTILYHTYTFTEKLNGDVILYQADGYYSHLKVFDSTHGTTTYRFLKNDINLSSAIIPGSDEIVFPYAQFANIFTVNKPDAKNYLVLGGGSYTIPRHMHIMHPELAIDVVETEPGLFALAHEYFELPETPLIQNFPIDARVFLQSTTTKYDVIFSDVMNSGHFLPPHLTTIEYFTSLSQNLAPDGILIMNFIGSLTTDEQTLTGSMIKTIGTVFPNYKIIATTGPTYKKIQNLLFIIRREGKPITIPDTLIHNPFAGTSTLATSMVVDPHSYQLDNQTVFTDDRSLLEPLVFAQFSKYK